jgi:uncharacterized repeat protein (TIGR03803 family)
VFAVTTAGAESVVHAFKGRADGANPGDALIAVGSKLYGTTIAGGGSPNCSVDSVGCGTVFSVTTDGAERVVYAFKGGTDGWNPESGLISLGGKLYGTTSIGGTEGIDGGGTVFVVTRAGAEKVLHSFDSINDGFYPGGSLITVGGTLYGTTGYGGGAANCQGGCGTVFAVTRDGAERVVYAFKGGSDGLGDGSGVINVGGTLYGTTTRGGNSANCPAATYTVAGCGTVFSVTPAGAEKIVYAFNAGSDGGLPVAGLLNVGGTLYGTTANGGSAICPAGTYTPPGCGTVYSVTPAGVEKVVYAFQAGTDGYLPMSGLINVGGTLYGTTRNGGTSGLGTVFAVTP